MKDAIRSKCRFAVLNSGRAGMRKSCLKLSYSILARAPSKVCPGRLLLVDEEMDEVLRAPAVGHCRRVT
eukprot:14594033-Alexandrium_andersonii.AAC.1